LPLPDGHRAAVTPGSFQNAERERIDVRDRECPRVVRGRGQVRRTLEAAEEVRLLEEDARRLARRTGDLVGIGDAAPLRDLDHLEPEARRIRLDHLTHLRVDGLGEDDGRPPGCVPGDVAGIRCHGGPVVARGVRDVEPGQLADRRLVLEDRLQHALAHLGLIRRVRREELAARHHEVHDRRHVVVVHAGAEERDLLARGDVARGELGQVGGELGLGERGLERERAAETHAHRHVGEQLLDGGDADLGQHGVPVVVGQRQVAQLVRGHWSATKRSYSAASMSASSSDGSVSVTRTSQPSP
jgi:hypothetical protein